MTRTAGVDFKFDRPYSIRSIVASLTEDGVRIAKDGMVTYMIDVAGMLEWQTSPAGRLDEILSRIDDMSNVSVTVGFVIYPDSSGSGGDPLFSRKKNEIYFIVTLYRRRIEGSNKFTDLGRYASGTVSRSEALATNCATVSPVSGFDTSTS